MWTVKFVGDFYINGQKRVDEELTKSSHHSTHPDITNEIYIVQIGIKSTHLTASILTNVL